MRFTNPKEYHNSIQFLLIFLLTLLFCYGFPKFIVGTIDIYVNISELEGGIGQSFSIGVGRILEIFLLGLVFVLIYFIHMKWLMSQVDENKGRNGQYLYILEISVMISICVNVMGVIVHSLFDYASALYGPYDTSELFLLLYFSDEWLGHHLIHLAYFTFIILALMVEFLTDNNRKMKWDEVGLSAVSGFGLFIVHGYAAYEGQCAFFLASISLVVLIIELIVIFRSKINPLERPLLLATLICYILVIGFFCFWILAFGWKPYYPFHYQPSEL